MLTKNELLIAKGQNTIIKDKEGREYKHDFASAWTRTSDNKVFIMMSPSILEQRDGDDEDEDYETIEFVSVEVSFDKSKHHEECPACNSGDITGGSPQACCGSTWQDITCNNCESSWQEIYIATISDSFEPGK